MLPGHVETSFFLKGHLVLIRYWMTTSRTLMRCCRIGTWGDVCSLPFEWMKSQGLCWNIDLLQIHLKPSRALARTGNANTCKELSRSRTPTQCDEKTNSVKQKCQISICGPPSPPPSPHTHNPRFATHSFVKPKTPWVYSAFRNFITLQFTKWSRSWMVHTRKTTPVALHLLTLILFKVNVEMKKSKRYWHLGTV